MPRIWNLRDKNTPADAVRVDRKTKWGNKFIMRNPSDAERNRVCDAYETWIAGQPALQEAARKELRGKDLACWCAPKRCHAETLMRIANGTREFTFYTGVKLENNLMGPLKGRLAPNGVWVIPFECDDVPEGATFEFACDSAPVPPGHIRREIKPGSGLLSKYAYFRLRREE